MRVPLQEGQNCTCPFACTLDETGQEDSNKEYGVLRTPWEVYARSYEYVRAHC